MRIHWLACNKNPARFREDASFFYRAQNPASEFEKQGNQCVLNHWKLERATESSDAPHSVVFHRPRDSFGFRRVCKKLREMGARLVADMDDLVFDEEFAHCSPGVVNGLVSLRETRKIFAAHRKALEKFDRISASTEPLAAHLRRVFPHAKVAVVRNAVPTSWELEQLPSRSETEHPLLAYFPGTRSHDRDFAQIAPAVDAFLAANQQWKLFLAGPLEFELQVDPARIFRNARVPFAEYPSLIRKADLVVAPLVDNPFNRCKSGIKVMEAGLFGIPSVATNIPDMERFSGEGVSLVGVDGNWETALEQGAAFALGEQDARRRLAERIGSRACREDSVQMMRTLLE